MWVSQLSISQSQKGVSHCVGQSDQSTTVAKGSATLCGSVSSVLQSLKGVSHCVGQSVQYYSR